MELLILIVIVLAIAVGFFSWKKVRDVNNKLLAFESKYQELMFQKKSSETRIGLVGEQFSPYIKDWPFGNPKEFRLLSHPIDGVNFGWDKITFVEIKTGKSRLSKNQRRIRDLVRNGKVDFVEFRVGEDGCETKSTKIKEDDLIDDSEECCLT